ncbi:MAG: hypothetical protein IJ571_06585 [Ruminococcus sp.]|nr:hypothetical protein [Ruminococcus sp.]
MPLTKYKKLLWLIPLLGLLIAVPLIGRTLAYNTDSEKQTNKVEFSNVEAKIQEEFPTITSSNLQGNTLKYKKKIWVENTGTAPCFVRVYLDFSDSAVRGYSKLSQDDMNYCDYADYPSVLSDWVKGDDGYFYYTKKLEVGDGDNSITSPLLEFVETEFPSGTDPYAYDIIVYSEAVQVVGSDGTVYNDYQEAFSNFNQ